LPAHTCSAAAFRWCCGCSRSTPKPGSPNTSTPAWPDPDEYRAILRNLLHLGGQAEYSTKTITVTLDRPDSPRVARAMQLVTEALNATPASIPGDHRALTYRLAEA